MCTLKGRPYNCTLKGDRKGRPYNCTLKGDRKGRPYKDDGTTQARSL